MSSFIIPPNNNDIYLLKSFFQILSRNGFYDYDKIEFMNKNSFYTLIRGYVDNSNVNLKCLGGFSESNYLDSMHKYPKNLVQYIELDEYDNIRIQDLVTKMNNSQLIFINLCNELYVKFDSVNNITIEKIFIKCLDYNSYIKEKEREILLDERKEKIIKLKNKIYEI